MKKDKQEEKDWEEANTVYKKPEFLKGEEREKAEKEAEKTEYFYKADQTPLIVAMDAGDYMFVWDKIKYVGYNIIPKINQRFLVFEFVCNDYDSSKNKNFLAYYKQQLRYKKSMFYDASYFTDDYRFVKDLIREKISPTGKLEGIAKELSDWEVGDPNDPTKLK